MKAVTIEFTEGKHAVLCKVAECNGVSVEECVYRMLDEYVGIRKVLMDAYPEDLSDVKVGGTS
jgi:hypothetical protein